VRLALYWQSLVPGPLPNRRSDASPWPMVVAMIVASVGVHLVLWPVGDRVLELHWAGPPISPMGGFLEVSLVEPDEDEDAAEREDQSRVQLPGQLVRQDVVDDERPPEKPSHRVSEFDSRVDRETRAPNRKSAAEYDRRTLGEQAGVSSSNSRRGSPQEPTPQHSLPLCHPTEGAADGLDHPAPGQLPVADDGAAQGEAKARGLRPTLQGTADAMRKTFGGAGSKDALDDVAEGTENHLNSDRFRFASFFNRMRDMIDEQWDPNAAMARTDPDGRKYGRTTRKTLLHIVLTPKGAVDKIDLLRSSGVPELDKEAIRSVHQAAPFVNPPPEMVDPATNRIAFDFMFTLLDGRRGSIHRYLR
jgi:TonB family protein